MTTTTVKRAQTTTTTGESNNERFTLKPFNVVLFIEYCIPIVSQSGNSCGSPIISTCRDNYKSQFCVTDYGNKKDIEFVCL